MYGVLYSSRTVVDFVVRCGMVLLVISCGTRFEWDAICSDCWHGRVSEAVHKG